MAPGPTKRHRLSTWPWVSSPAMPAPSQSRFVTPRAPFRVSSTSFRDNPGFGNSFAKTKRYSKSNDVGRRQLRAQHPIGNGAELDVRPEIHAPPQIIGERSLDSYEIERRFVDADVHIVELR